jgi:hypothetical protein
VPIDISLVRRELKKSGGEKSGPQQLMEGELSRNDSFCERATSGRILDKEKIMDLIAVSFAFHTIGIVIWVGAVLLMPMGIIPAMETMDAPAQQKFLQKLVQWWGPLLIASGLVVGVTGWIQTFDVDDVNLDVLIIKHIVVVLLILVDLYVVLWPGRLLLKMNQDSAERQKIVKALKWACWIQAAIGIAVLLVVGQLMA